MNHMTGYQQEGGFIIKVPWDAQGKSTCYCAVGPFIPQSIPGDNTLILEGVKLLGISLAPLSYGTVLYTVGCLYP